MKEPVKKTSSKEKFLSRGLCRILSREARTPWRRSLRIAGNTSIKHSSGATTSSEGDMTRIKLSRRTETESYQENTLICDSGSGETQFLSTDPVETLLRAKSTDNFTVERSDTFRSSRKG